jgi:hypothetical protein
MSGVPGVIEDALATVHNAISSIIGTTPPVAANLPGTLHVITLSQATQLGLTPTQLMALGYIIVGN